MGRTKYDWARFDHYLSWVFDHSSRGSCHLKEGEQSLRAKKLLAMESVNSLRISAPPWWPLREGRDGKCEGRNEKCKILARESVSSSPIVRIFGKGKCKFIANFSATMVTSLRLSLSLSVSLSLSLSHQKYLTHNIGSASALPIITHLHLLEHHTPPCVVHESLWSRSGPAPWTRREKPETKTLSNVVCEVDRHQTVPIAIVQKHLLSTLSQQLVKILCTPKIFKFKTFLIISW